LCLALEVVEGDGDSALGGRAVANDGLVVVYHRAGAFGRLPDLAELGSLLEGAALGDHYLRGSGSIAHFAARR
jgi:hypothetical protein